MQINSRNGRESGWSIHCLANQLDDECEILARPYGVKMRTGKRQKRIQLCRMSNCLKLSLQYSRWRLRDGNTFPKRFVSHLVKAVPIIPMSQERTPHDAVNGQLRVPAGRRRLHDPFLFRLRQSVGAERPRDANPFDSGPKFLQQVQSRNTGGRIELLATLQISNDWENGTSPPTSIAQVRDDGIAHAMRVSRQEPAAKGSQPIKPLRVAGIVLVIKQVRSQGVFRQHQPYLSS
jgi:hypothetical protein